MVLQVERLQPGIGDLELMPLHFRAPMTQTVPKKTSGQSQPKGSVAPMHTYFEANGIEKQLQFDSRKTAMQRWTGNRGGRSKKLKVKS